MREIVHLQAGQCGNQIGAKVRKPASWSTNIYGVFYNIIPGSQFHNSCAGILDTF